MATASTTPATASTLRPEAHKTLQRFRNRWLMRLYFLQRLPTLFLWRVRIEEVTPEQCTISLPYGWRTQNPFRSTYFAAQAGAAELSTGLLAMLAIAGQGRVSMLVTKVECQFTKKADGRAYFECTDGPLLQETVQRALETGEGQTVTVTSVARLKTGEEVSRSFITWSFKKKG